MISAPVRMNAFSKRFVAFASGAGFVILACQNMKIVATENTNESALEDTSSATLAESDVGTSTDEGGDVDGDSDTDSNAGTDGQTCAGLSAAPGDDVRTVRVGDAERSFILHIPDAYTGTSPVPLIIDYHPIGSSGAAELSSSPYPSVTDAEGVVMAFPDGLSGPSGTAWNIGPCCVDEADDIGFARAMVEDVALVACIDRARIYAVGTSMGGGMAHTLACQAGDTFAAVAPSAFDLIEETIEACAPPHPITVISFRGTSDPLVPYEGGYSNVVPDHPITFLGAVGTLTAWAEIDGCTGTPADDGDGCQWYSAAQCSGGVEVGLCTEEGGGIRAGVPTIAWPVLKRHSMPEEGLGFR